MKMRDEILHVQMLGGFFMVYRGKKLVFERNLVSKTCQLLQILFLHLNDGITKEDLFEALYGRDEVENQNASLNNIIFRLRKQLETMGLPKGKYFSLNNGVYQWNGDIPVEVDIHCFEKKIKEAWKSEDEKERAEKMADACSLYTGEFLPMMIGEDWVTVSNIYYQELYFAALLEACTWLKKEKEFEKIYELTTAAAKFYPFEEWQIWRIDSLIALKRYKEAMHIYKETTHLFFDELGLSPSPEMLERFHLISDKIEQSVSAIEEIKGVLREKGWRTGAYYCTFPSFIDAYHIVSRMMERNGNSVFIMLCTLTDNKGKINDDSEKCKEASEWLRKAISSSLRRVDFYTRYNRSQYLIMLLGTKQENCNAISRRIDQNFKENSNGRYKVNYYVASVAEFHADDGEEEVKFASMPASWDKTTMQEEEN